MVDDLSLSLPGRGGDGGRCLSRLLIALLSMLSATTAADVAPSPHSSSSSEPTRPPLPNVVLILTDDLDLALGGTDFLTKTRRLIADRGADLPNWFVHTPVCCPSRAELLTGRMFHNLKVPHGETPEGLRSGCMHVDVTSNLSHPFYSEYYFARHFERLGYTTGVFGKHLNNYNPPGPPPGVDRWLINDGGEYLDPSFSWASSSGMEEATLVKFDNCTDPGDGRPQPCYSTSVIGNSSVAWIRDHHLAGRGDGHPDDDDDPAARKPFFAYVSVKAPHIQDGPGFPVAIPAPWYANATVGPPGYSSGGIRAGNWQHQPTPRAPRTPNYNASCPDHHWLVRQQPPLTEEVAEKVDELYVSRLRTLLSVDDLVEEMIWTLDDLGVLEDTYVIFTSDNGYRLGQFSMPQGKFHPYENDVRVPFMIRGPGIRPGSSRPDVLGTHVDVMPTILGLVQSSRTRSRSSGRGQSDSPPSAFRGGGSGADGGPRGTTSSSIPETMDGEDLAPLLLEPGRVGYDGSDATAADADGPSPSRRNAVLIEYIGLGDVVRYRHLEDTYNNTFRALRVIDDGRTWYTAPVETGGGGDEVTTSWRNLKYVEFTDCRTDWNFTGEPAEVELFDLDVDPYEMTNLIDVAPRDLIDRLRSIMRRLFTCRGRGCRDAQHENRSDEMVERDG